jgi:hypothetical protein
MMVGGLPVDTIAMDYYQYPSDSFDYAYTISDFNYVNITSLEDLPTTVEHMRYTRKMGNGVSYDFEGIKYPLQYGNRLLSSPRHPFENNKNGTFIPTAFLIMRLLELLIRYGMSSLFIELMDKSINADTVFYKEFNIPFEKYKQYFTDITEAIFINETIMVMLNGLLTNSNITSYKVDVQSDNLTISKIITNLLDMLIYTPDPNTFSSLFVKNRQFSYPTVVEKQQLFEKIVSDMISDLYSTSKLFAVNFNIYKEYGFITSTKNIFVVMFVVSNTNSINTCEEQVKLLDQYEEFINTLGKWNENI